MTKFSAQLFRNMYKNVVLLCCGVLGYDTLFYGRRGKWSGEESVWECKVEDWM